MIVYKATNKINGKAYIGLTKCGLKTRRYQHERDARIGKNSYFHRAIRKHGKGSFEWKIVANCQSPDAMKTIERNLIQYYKFLGCYNLTDGGDGTWGRLASEETKRKISENHADFSGEKHPRYGTKTSQETRDKIRQSLLGRKMPERRCTKIYNFKNKEGSLFSGTVYDLCEKFHLTASSIRGVTSGRRKSHKGWSINP